jgi:plasmid stabilization system protein ParE
MNDGAPDDPRGYVAAAEFHPDAEAELEQAIAFYEQRAEGLGADFLAAAEEAVRRAVEWPSAGTPLEAGRRRVYLRRFPYAVVYRVLSESRIRVLAVADLRRRPRYWRRRR